MAADKQLLVMMHQRPAQLSLSDCCLAPHILFHACIQVVAGATAAAMRVGSRTATLAQSAHLS